MSSQCKGYTKSGTPCKITIVLPNGYCRVHQEQYVIEKPEDTKVVEEVVLKVENEAIGESVPVEKRDDVDVRRSNSMPYVRYSSSGKRWVLVPVLIMVFFWVVSRLLRKKR